MTRKPVILLLIPLMMVLLWLNAFAYTGESDLNNTIRALNIMTGRTNAEPILASDHIDGDHKIGLGEAIYWMQDAAGIPFVDLQAQDYEEDFLLSALDFEIPVGERQEITVFDTPRVGLDDQAYNRENLIFTLIKGEGVARVEIEDDTDSVEDTYYFFRGLSQGVAVFQISYDGYTGQKPLVVVNVTNADATGPALETDITLTKYDILYFTGDSIDFSFKVITDEDASVTAELNGEFYEPQNGEITVSLANGYNPIVITAEGSSGTTTKVVNVRAKKCAITVVNTTRPDSDLFYEGDTIKLDFIGLTVPVPKVSHIYNPSSNTVTYDTTMPRYSVITGGTAQYTVKNVGMELTASGDFILTNGHLAVNWFGEALYSEVPVGTAPYNLNAPQTDKNFCVLPDIPITVLENPDYDPEIFTITLANTEDIWPGDMVVLNIPDLDTETIAVNHAIDTVSWMHTTLLDSYTFFVTDIPGLETVTSDHAENLSLLDTLKTIKVWIPEDTTPGTYKIRGGYVWVKYGPTWWTKVAYYHKGKIPDVTIEVKAAVPGQVHGAVLIPNDTVKNLLAMALGKGDGYTGNLTTAELKTLTGEIDLSGSGITDADMDLMQYLTGVTAIDFSGNTEITSETVKKATFDWTLEKSLDFSGCTGLTELLDAAFYECANLASITLPDTITALGDDCFNRCAGLTSMVLPSNLETIGERCFSRCFALTQIIIPSGVTVLGEEVFLGCISLQEVQLPVNLISLGANCFQSCTGLTEITLPDSLTIIGDNCFYGCKNLMTINLPPSLTTIGEWAFSFCDSLSILTFPASLETIGKWVFNNNGIMVVDARESKFTSVSKDDEWGLKDSVAFLTGTDAMLEPQSAEIKMIEETLTVTHQIPESETIFWSSSNPDIAVVEEGKVTGVRGGSVLISARTTQGTYSGYCRVTITDDGRTTLSTLDLSGIALNKPFDPRTYIYTADITGDVRNTIVTLEVSDGGSALVVNGQAVSPGVPLPPMALTCPETNIEIKVSSADNTITKTYTVRIAMAAVTVTNDGDIILGNLSLKEKLANAAGKGENYLGNLTVEDLGSITGSIDLSDSGIFGGDMKVLRYLTGVSAIDLSDNTGLTGDSINPSTFDWTLEKSLDFSGCTGIVEWFNKLREKVNLTGIVLPETVTRIRSNAFQDCTKLAHVVLPSSLITIEQTAFYGCLSLTSIDLPEGLETIGGSCFSGTPLKTLTLPSSLTAIGRSCFKDCEQLTHLIIPSGVTTIGLDCFKNCTSLTLLDLRQTSFTSADVAEWEVPDTTLVVYPGTQSAGLNTTETAVNLGEGKLNLSHTIPDGQEVIWNSTNADVAAVSSDGVVTGVTVGTAFVFVSSLDGTYFDYCYVTCAEPQTHGLTSLTLTGTSLDQPFEPQRFYYTAKGNCFTQIQVTATPTVASSTLSVNGVAATPDEPSQPISLSMGDNSIDVAVTTAGTTQTYVIHIAVEAVHEGETDVSIANEAFMKKLAVAAGKGPDYMGPLSYDELKSIQGDLDLSGLGLTDADMAVMKYLSNVSDLNLSGNTDLTSASVTGAIFNWAMPSGLDFSGCTGITEVLDNAFQGYAGFTGIVLPATVIRLGESSFAQCTSLKAFEIPAGVTQIGESCFAGSGIVSIVFPGSITTLGRNICQDCTGLTHADLSGISVQTLADAWSLFDGCTAITDMANIVLPEGLTALPRSFFSRCSGITAIDLPETITVLGDNAFSYCTGITEADLSNMTELGQGVLAGCVNLVHAVLPTGITSLGITFQGCSALATVELPDSLTSIGAWTFRESGITHLTVPAGVTSIGLFCFQDCNALTLLDLSATSLNSMSIRMCRVPSTTTVLYAANDAGLSTTELTLSNEATATLTANDIPEGTPVTWISSNTAVATVTDEGVVTALAPGIAMIAVKADDGSYNGTCEVTVTAAP